MTAAEVDSKCGDEESKSNTILSRKLKKLVESQIENDVETQEALRELSSFFKENTLKNRRQLRGEIERRSLQINTDFLAGFLSVKDVLDEVHAHAKAVNDACLEMQAQLKATKSKTQELIAQTTTLRDQTEAVERRKAVIDRFLSNYQLREDQEAALTDADLIDASFFDALERAQAIHRECKGFLASGSLAKQTTAAEVMEQMSHLHESGMQHLYRWAQDSARTAHQLEEVAGNQGDGGGTTIVLRLSQAMGHLAKRPPLFRRVLDTYCSSRRSLLVRAFLDALTMGGPQGTPKPIELHAHDPLRYVGDMLAWLHQSTPTEVDNLKSLLKLVDEVVAEPLPVASGEDEKEAKDANEIVEDAVCDIVDGVCRPLRSRIEQILMSEATPVVLYKLANLIRFYALTIASVAPSRCDLVKALQDLDEMAFKQFISVLQATVRQQTMSAAGKFEAGFDLAPSQSTAVLLSLLAEILSSTSVMEEQQYQLEEIVNTVVDPLVRAVENTAATLPTTDQDVYLLNSLYHTYTTLALFKFNDAKLHNLDGEMQLHLDTLTSEQTSSLIANLEIQPVCTMLAQAQGSGHQRPGSNAQPLSKIKGMEAESLRAFMSKFDEFLVSPEFYLLPQIRLLVSSKHRKTVSKRALQVVSATYKQLYEAVVNPENEYDNPTATIVPKTPEKVDLLLQL